MDEARRRWWAGWGAIAAGTVIAWMVWRHPEGLRAPAFVAYAAAAAFGLAGISLVAGQRAKRSLQAWLAVVLLACMLAPAVWIAFGSGPRRCAMGLADGLLRSFGTRADLACRIGFGIGAVIGLAMLLLFVRQAVQASRAR